MKPAEIVIMKFGGVRATARAIAVNPGTVSRWTRSRELGGCAGEIPTRNHRKILSAARMLKINIMPAELVYDEQL